MIKKEVTVSILFSLLVTNGITKEDLNNGTEIPEQTRNALPHLRFNMDQYQSDRDCPFANHSTAFKITPSRSD